MIAGTPPQHKRRIALWARIFALGFAIEVSGCSKPTEIVFGPAPFKQFIAQNEEFKKLPKEDYDLLQSYIYENELFRPQFHQKSTKFEGQTVGAILIEARVWDATVKADMREERRRKAEAAQQLALPAGK